MMTLEEAVKLAVENQRSIASFDAWAQGIERRLVDLEKSKDVLREVELALREVVTTNRGVGEKLNDMNKALEKISHENQLQHDALGKRVKLLEEKPGNRWQTATTTIITSLISLGIGYLLAQICAYGVSEVLQPNLELTEEAVAVLVRETALP